MLKKRIIASLVLHGTTVVQSIGFKRYLPVGDLPTAIEFLNSWGIDEIAVLDILARKEGRRPDFAQIRLASSKCLVPLAVGGGVTSLEDAGQLVHNGADKVIVNRPLFDNPKLITEIARSYGDQCVVVSIDAVRTDNGCMAYNHLSKSLDQCSVVEAAVKAQELGAGELFINSVDRDGSYAGYDCALVKEVCSNVSIPVIACGGAASGEDFATLFSTTGASAACAGNFFHFTEHSVVVAKHHLRQSRDDVRLETHATYNGHLFDSRQRLIKKSDEELEHMLYVKIEKDEI